MRFPLTNDRFWHLSNAALYYIIRDANEAAKCMRGHDANAETKYLDQVNDACTVLHHRRNGQ